MIIFGVDPGTTRLGWGVISDTRALAYGCIEPEQKARELRLLTIYKTLTALLKKYKPDILAIEELFFSLNAKTAISVAEARGIVLLAAAQANIAVISYTPLVIKQTITGTGAADKKQVQKMVQLQLKLKSIPTPDDAADALAIAMTHAFTKKFL